MKKLLNLKEPERPVWAAEAGRKETCMEPQARAVSDLHCVGKLLAWPRHRRPSCWMCQSEWDEFTRDHLELDSPRDGQGAL